MTQFFREQKSNSNDPYLSRILQSDKQEGLLLSPQRLLCLVVHCLEVSELSLHLWPVAYPALEKKTNTVNNPSSA